MHSILQSLKKEKKSTLLKDQPYHFLSPEVFLILNEAVLVLLPLGNVSRKASANVSIFADVVQKTKQKTPEGFG